MSSFPLLDSIKFKLKNTEPKEYKDQDLADLALKLSKMKKDKHELIYTLIKSYNNTLESPTLLGLPFECKQLKSGIKCDLKNLPLELVQILDVFYNMN